MKNYIKQNPSKAIFAALFLISSIGLYAFKPNPASGYDYMTVLAQTTGSGKGLNVSISGKDFKQIDLSKDNKGYYDFNFMLTFIQEYEGYGWQLEPSTVTYSVSPNGNASCFAVMKKVK